MALKPSVKDSQNCWKVRIPRGMYMRKVKMSAANEPRTRASEDEQFAKASEIALSDSSWMPPPE